MRSTAPLDPFVAHCVELMAPLGSVRSKRMFGGHGLYLDEHFIAILTHERLYLKTDADTQPRFEAAGCEPFVYDGGGKRVQMGFWTVPPEALESPALMTPWARLALQAALAKAKARAGAPPRPRAR
ncbi:TfoX/Sxy family protein [Aquincola tertiaricarbonis]|uniref:TfoX/Sxy family protein n=1 Tax=Aquincola tertiaricarbonis TaxID=391953 RepID=UPI000614EBE0|nr:TfoX/Sxy family protein [Aquincola tertiaricarbonis]